MADYISGFTALTGASVDPANDLITVVDASETGNARNKKMTFSELFKAAYAADISPTQITADQNDYNPTGLSSATVLRLDSDASRNITGLQGGAEGREIVLVNVGANNIVLKDADAASSAANRFAMDADLTLSADMSALLIYDATSSRWRLIAVGRATDSGVTYATSGEINTGTEAAKAISPDALAGSNFGIRYITVVLNGTTALTTSDAAYFRIPAAYNGMNLVSVAASVGTGAAGSSSSGTPTFTVKNVTDGNQMLSTNLTVDANEYTSATAATPAVINGSFDDVVTDDLIEVACTVAGTGVTYATITLGFQLP